MRTQRRLIALAAALALLIAVAPSGWAAAKPKVAVLATSVRLESSFTIYIGSDGVGSVDTIRYEILPLSASANSDANLRYWYSDNEKIVKVTSAGKMTAVKYGTTYVRLHLEDGSGLEAKCKVTVSRQPITSIKLDQTRLQRLPGTYYQLTATVSPANAYNKAVKWSSSDTSKAKVDQRGYVKCIKPGTVQIHCKAKSGSAKVSCTFIIGYDFAVSKFRVITIVNSDYPDAIGKVPAFVPSTEEVYSYFKAMYNDDVAKVCKGYRNQTGDQIRQILTEMVGNQHTTDNDVTIFYYSGRGEVSTDAVNKGALLGIDADKSKGLVTIAEIQQQFDKIPGTVVLILDSHMSGQFIKSKGDTASFNSAVIRQFQAAKAISGASKTKYKIITSCAAKGKPYYIWDDVEQEGYSFFSKALALAFAGGGDRNGDDVITLREAYYYTNKKVNSYIASYNKKYKKSVSQSVSVWPPDDYAPICTIGGAIDDDGDGVIDL